jgi:hypothetical protein
MNPLARAMVVSGLLMLAHSTAMAQPQPPACPRLEKPFLRVPMVDDVRSGCPFSAVIQLTTTQTLADGTHIQRNVKALVYRDSLGRIRYESYGPTDTTPSMIEIYDPVEGFSYFFLPQKAAIAYRHKLGQPAADARVGTQDQHIPAPEPKIATETLGVQQFEGVLATGTKTTRTTPAGAEGNDRALTTVRETWSSRDIGITLLEKTSDPRNGDSERRMMNLEQTEPEATLFQVPADYKIQDQ